MKKYVKAAITSALLGAAIAGIGHYFDLLTAQEWLLYDQRQRLMRAHARPPDDIALVMLDEASLATLKPDLGRFPWPRWIYGDVLRFLKLGHPRAVIFDILFSEPDVATPDNDRQFATASAELTSVHAARILLDGDDVDATANEDLKRHRIGTAAGLTSSVTQFIPPIPQLWETAAAVGFVDLTPDRDGVVRRTPLARSHRDDVFPALSIAVLRAAAPLSSHVIEDFVGDENQRVVPSAVEAFNIAFYSHFKQYSFASLVSAAKNIAEGNIENLLVHPDEFRDKIVFIGASAAGLDDLKPTPLSPATPGVYIHASVVGNMLSGDVLQHPPGAHAYIMIVLLAFVSAFATVTSTRLVWQIALPPLVFATFTAFGFWLFSLGWIVAMAAPLMSALATWLIALAYTNVIQGKDRRKVRRLLAQYVSPSMLAAVVDKYEDAAGTQAGTREHMTVLFSDIRSFTSISENLEAEQVVELLNAHFSVMTEVIFSYDGTLDKFIGDAIMAFWGAPLRCVDHAEKAVRAAIAMTEGLDKVNTVLRTRNLPQIRLGIGLNTGQVILGNIGSERKLDYTVIGDNVNLASRMEGLTSKYGCGVLISESTFDAVATDIPCVLIDRVRVKGKKKPIGIYAPLAVLERAAESNCTSELKELLDLAFTHYSQRQWDEALAAYGRVPIAGVREVFCRRCQDFKANPPDAAWDGITSLDSK